MNDTRSRILKALSTIMEENKNTPNITMLANMAGVSRSTLYKYYPDLVAKLRSEKSRSEVPPIERQALKINILQRKFEQQKNLVASLTRICTEQLVEIFELNAAHRDDLEMRDLKIAFLESQIAKNKRPILKTVK